MIGPQLIAASIDERSLVSLSVGTAIRLGRDGAQMAKHQFGAALFLKASFDAGFLRYVHLPAERC